MLTKDAIRNIYNGHLVSQPTLQVLNVKKVPNNDRYRLLVSDGANYLNAMGTAALNSVIQHADVDKDTIVRFPEYTVQEVNHRKIIIFMQIEILDRNYPNRIGEPVNIEKHLEKTDKNNSASKRKEPPSDYTSAASRPSYQQQAAAPVSPVAYGSGNGRGASSSVETMTTVPIKVLNPYQNKWTIKARVSNKSDMRTWSNAKGDGKLFSVTLIDASGEIKATAFNETAERFFPILEENKVYYFSKGSIKIARKQFSNVQNDYEISLDQMTEIIPCNDASSVPAIRYNFVSIDRLNDFENNSMIDLIAVVKEAGEVSQFIAKTSQKQMTKRDLVVADQSNNQVTFTLWGKTAESFDVSGFPVIACKGVRVSDFNGRSLSLGSSGTIVRNPDIPEAHQLKGWFDSAGKSAEFASQSVKKQGGVIAQRRPLSAIQNEHLGQSDKPDYLTVRATTTNIKSDRNMWYNACPGENCQKKVTQEGSEWRCEKCQRTYGYCDYRYIMGFNVSDCTGSAWISTFNDVAQEILGHSASELNQFKETGNDDAYQAVFNEASFKTYSFTLRIKSEMYNDEVRVKSTVLSAESIDFVKESNYLADMIDQM
eukprot:Partr_v1_DN26403_c0_g1_i1_m23575 putative Replication Protein